MLTYTELEKLTTAAKKIIKKTAKFIESEYGNVAKHKIEHKGLNDLVSYVDKTAEQILVKDLSVLFPKATFVTEEATIENQKSEYMWIIDPLDGTTNFLHNIPHFSVSIALVHHNEPILGIVHDITRNECFWAFKGSGTYINDKQVKVSQSKELLTSVLGMGFPYRKYTNMKAVAESLEYFLKNTRGLRRIGSAALDLAYVAAGRLDAFYEVNLNAWDVAGGIILVREAGGKVQDFSANDNALFGMEIIASNPNIIDELRTKIQDFYIVD